MIFALWIGQRRVSIRQSGVRSLNHCHAVKGEREQTRSLVIGLVSVERYRPTIEALVKSRYGVFAKFRTGFSVENGKLGAARSSNLAWIDYDHPGLNFSHVFPDAAFRTDPFGGFGVKSQHILDEAFHLVLMSSQPGE